MDTKLFQMKETIDESELKAVAKILQEGETVAFPTETVYGLGANATDEAAVQKIFQAKGRPSDNPLIVHVATKEDLYELTKDLPAYVDALIDHFSPGPITYVLADAGKVAPTVTAGLSTVGVRIPSHPVALAILQATKLPLAAPSANRSGRPSPTEAAHVATDLMGKIGALVDGGSTDVGIESTVLDCTGDFPLILRPGAITADDIARIAGACHTYEVEGEADKPKSPGMKYVHYAPEVPLILVDRERLSERIAHYQEKAQRIGLLYESEAFAAFEVAQKRHMGQDDREIAQELYRHLRAFSKADVDVLICEYPSLAKGHAILDRLERAATEII